MSAKARDARNRLLPTKAFVTVAERTRIEARAKAAGLSISAYLRAAGLAQPIRSVLDQVAVQLAKVNGNRSPVHATLRVQPGGIGGFRLADGRIGGIGVAVRDRESQYGAAVRAVSTAGSAAY